MFIQSWRELGPGQRRMVLAIAGAVVLAYALCIALCVSVLTRNRENATRNHALRMSVVGVEPGNTPPNPLPPEGDFTTVRVGTYVDGIDGLSLRDSTWSAELHVWFHWIGDPSLDPGGRMVIIDGKVTRKELLEEFHGQDGTNYQRYRLSGKFLKFFDTLRVPVEGHMLNVFIEDGSRDGTRLRYVADPTSGVSSRARIPGYRITGARSTAKPHTYRVAYGDPRWTGADSKTFSQYILGIDIARSSLGVYGKIFLSLFAALSLTLSSFFVKASDVAPRLALPTAAYFGAVANSYVVNSILPPSGTFGLVDYVLAFGQGTIFLTVVLGMLSTYFLVRKNEKEMSFVLDRTMFFVVAFCCVAANTIVPWSAIG